MRRREVSGADDGKTSTRWGKVPAWWMGHPGVDADGFAVLAALATYADANGTCSPSQSTIASRLSRSRPWVNRELGRLVEAGLIEKVARSRSNGGTTSCLYRLRMEQSMNPSPQPCHERDTPCHAGDRSQTVPKQTRLRRRTAGATPVISTPPSDWTPSPEAIEEAASRHGGIDLLDHAARFVRRCIERRYRYAADDLDRAWSKWLDEDQSLAGRRASGNARPGRRRARNEGQFDAWAAAAMELSNA